MSYDIVPMAVGDKVTYIPTEAGPHNIYITYGGLEVPGKVICHMAYLVKSLYSSREWHCLVDITLIVGI